MVFYADTVSEVYTARPIQQLLVYKSPRSERTGLSMFACEPSKTLSLQNENIDILIDISLTDFHRYILYTENDQVFSY